MVMGGVGGEHPINFVPHPRSDGFQSDSSIGGQRILTTQHRDQIAMMLLSAIRNMGQDVKLDFPEFDRKSDDDGFIDWLNRVDRIFLHKRYVVRSPLWLDSDGEEEEGDSVGGSQWMLCDPSMTCSISCQEKRKKGGQLTEFFRNIKGTIDDDDWDQVMLNAHVFQVLGAAINVYANRHKERPDRLIDMLTSSHRKVLACVVCGCLKSAFQIAS
ncbi:hypothetical protein GIB67_022110 [Kingdonia uniflora]|uniref:ZFYVE26-like TPR repeats domain-containing protein n=1 Tax=Kingdonia uniflora TaxID=39325 RepID=A0A7J7LY27_9MAGN|nr:hypothetical protein GIB67_022110 [Kingdonia uniflora]